MRLLITAFAFALMLFPSIAMANCSDLPDHASLKDALTKARAESNGGLNLDMWGTIVDRAGRVCAVHARVLPPVWAG